MILFLHPDFLIIFLLFIPCVLLPIKRSANFCFFLLLSVLFMCKILIVGTIHRIAIIKSGTKGWKTMTEKQYRKADAMVYATLMVVMIGIFLNMLGMISSGLLEPETAMRLLLIGPEYTQVVIKTEKAASQLRWTGAERISRRKSIIVICVGKVDAFRQLCEVHTAADSAGTVMTAPADSSKEPRSKPVESVIFRSTRSASAPFRKTDMQ